MVQRLVVVLLVMVILVGCGVNESGKPKDAGSVDQAEKKVPLQKTKKITKDSPEKITWD